jgi:Cdc6-like AAA superfamily ATPase
MGDLFLNVYRGDFKMSSKPKSWKEIRDQRRKVNFVGRTEQLRVFSDNYVSDVPNYMVIAVTGEGGVGKTTLLKQFESIASAPNIAAITIRCDDRNTSPVAVMRFIAEELGKHEINHKEFDERLLHPRIRSWKMLTSP